MSSGEPVVSVIIPARNAASTIQDAIASLEHQRFQEWEAIVVDDGSTDETLPAASLCAASDPRICVLSGPPRGVSEARNQGIRRARGRWFLFLDADDWILPSHLSRLLAEAELRPDLDVIHCGWSRVGVAGETWENPETLGQADLFGPFSRGCEFTIHSCIVKRQLVLAAGGFDTSLAVCEDWDLWQRLARAGARFGAIPDVLALYRTHTSSCTRDITRLLESGMRVIETGHHADIRVRNAVAWHENGEDPAGLPDAKFNFAMWSAACGIGSGQELDTLLSRIERIDPRFVSLGAASQALFDGLRQESLANRCGAREYWNRSVLRSREFLSALDQRTGIGDFGRAVQLRLEGFVADFVGSSDPATWGATIAVPVETTHPIGDIATSPDIERAHCEVRFAGARIGTFQVAVCDGLLPAYLLADQIAAEFAWPVLGLFFDRTVYRHIGVRQETSCLRNGTVLSAKVETSTGLSASLHDSAGWTVFLQELWGIPEWPSAHFYDAQLGVDGVAEEVRVDGPVAIEISRPLPDLLTDQESLDVFPLVGGLALGAVRIDAPAGRATAQQLRAGITAAGGLELCVRAVREGILGKPLDDRPIRRRLQQAAQSMGFGGTAIPLSEYFQKAKQGMRFAGGTTLLGGRLAGPVGAARRACLPRQISHLILQSAAADGLPVVPPVSPALENGRLFYAPELVTDEPAEGLPTSEALCAAAPPHSNAATPPHSNAATASQCDRGFWETFFAKQADPWDYGNSYEQVKYRQTLSLFPRKPIGAALELACAEGHFTGLLATLARHVIASDVSEIALRRASERCSGLPNVEFRPLDLLRDELPSGQDLVVCSEVLYYLGDVESLKSVAKKLQGALAPGGMLITAHANFITEEPDLPGFDWGLPFGARTIGEVLAATHGLQLVAELRTPLYRIHALERQPAGAKKVPHKVIWADAAEPLPPAIAAIVKQPGQVNQKTLASEHLTTGALPILMYHRVAPAGAAALRRYRVDPEAFAAQMRYLADAGYRSVSFDEWSQAAWKQSPIPGRVVILTFDDAYCDFQEYAWPVLQQHGLGAYVFAVTGLAGRTNAWDAGLEEVPLLSWDEMRRLRSEGVRFGSHTHSHRLLTALPPAGLAAELLQSRAEFRRHMGEPAEALAYPFGDHDEVVRQLAGACGYLYAVSTHHSLCSARDRMLSLPRLEIAGADDLEAFVNKLAGQQSARPLRGSALTNSA